LGFAGEREARWPAFVELTVPKLRAQGWHVEIDASFRHRLVDVTSDDAWQASADETTDGWFDVAIGLDVDGHRIDLLPILRDVAQRADVFGDLAHLGPDDVYYVSLADTRTTVAFPAARLQTIPAMLVEHGTRTLCVRRDVGACSVRAPQWSALSQRIPAYAGTRRSGCANSLRGYAASRASRA